VLHVLPISSSLTWSIRPHTGLNNVS
jgi:hypothetical protein